MTLKDKIQRLIDENNNPSHLAGAITFISEDYSKQLLEFIIFLNIKIVKGKFYLPDNTLIAKNKEEMYNQFKIHYHIE